VARAREVFGLKDCLVITDDFHLPRAVFLANYYKLKAVGFEAKPLPWKTSVSTRVREYFARVKLLLDLYVLKTKPKFGPV
jgi:SanA protein